MTAFSPALIVAGIVGTIIGSFLNVVIARVPAGMALNRPRQCPTCDAPVRLWQSVPVISWVALRRRCAHCGAPVSARYPLVELATGVAFVGVMFFALEAWAGMALGALPLVVSAYLYLAAVSIALTIIDLDTHRLPNAIVLPSYVVLTVLFTGACLFGAPWEDLLRAATAGVGLFVFYWLLRGARSGGMGGGDVKLAGVLGAALGWVGWGAVVVGAFSAFLLGGIVGTALVLAGRATRKTALPFGPFMVVGAWVGIVAGEPIARGYGGLLSLG